MPVTTNVLSHLAIMSIAKKILELNSTKTTSRPHINSCLAYLVNHDIIFNKYALTISQVLKIVPYTSNLRLLNPYSAM